MNARLKCMRGIARIVEVSFGVWFARYGRAIMGSV